MKILLREGVNKNGVYYSKNIVQDLHVQIDSMLKVFNYIPILHTKPETIEDVTMLDPRQFAGLVTGRLSEDTFEITWFGSWKKFASEEYVLAISSTAKLEDMFVKHIEFKGFYLQEARNSVWRNE